MCETNSEEWSQSTGNDEEYSLRDNATLFREMMAQYTHEDNLYWMQIRHLMILQLAALASAFNLGVSPLSSIVLCIAALLSYRFWSLANVIRVNRNMNIPSIAALGKMLASRNAGNAIREVVGNKTYDDWGPLAIAAHSLEEHNDAGHLFQRFVFWIAVSIDLVFAAVILLELERNLGWLKLLHPSLHLPT